MGGVRNISGDLHRKAGGSGVRAARVSKKDAADKPTRSRTSSRPTRTTATNAKKVALEDPLEVTEFPSVWEAMGFSPQQSANLNLRAGLLINIREIIRKNKWKQVTAAKRCGVSQPRINDLLQARVDKFSLDALVNIANALGWQVSLTMKAA